MLVTNFSEHTARNGKPFWRMTLRLAGAKETVDAIVWNNGIDNFNHVPIVGALLVGPVYVEDEYNGKKQLIISDVSSVLTHPPTDMLNAYREPPVVQQEETIKEMFEGYDWPEPINSLMIALKNRLESTGEWENFIECPAGAKNHHPVRAGLIQHTMEMIRIAEALVENIKWLNEMIDWSVLRAAIIFHDIGKIHEYDMVTGGWAPTQIGQLLGHVCYGVLLIEELWPQDASQLLKTRLQHAVLCHHGKALSPVAPCTPEATLINFIDGISASMSVYRDAPDVYSNMLGAKPLLHA